MENHRKFPFTDEFPIPSGNLLQFAIEAMAIEIVDLPRKKKSCFAIVMLVYQRVIIPYNSLSLL